MPSHMRLQVAVVLAPTNDCRLVTLISRRYCLDMFPIFETKGRRFGVYFAFVNRMLSVHSSTIMTEQGFVSGQRSHSLVCRNRLRSHTKCLSSRCNIINKRYSQISLQFLVCCSRFIRYTAGITMRFMLYTQQITGSVHIMIAFEVTVTSFATFRQADVQSSFVWMDTTQGYVPSAQSMQSMLLTFLFLAFGHLIIHTSMNKTNVI